MSRTNTSQLPARRSRSRKLRIENLEERRLLATVTVSNNLDIVNGDTSTIVALMNDDGGDGISIREAIDATNNSSGADEINFDFATDVPETILLTAGELRVFEALTINGRAPGLITIDAQQHSRVMRLDNFNTTVDNFAVTLAGLTLTGGYTSSAGNFGGAILASNLYLFINDSIIEGNHTSGSTSWGGALFSEGYVTVTNSAIRDNYTTGDTAVGGAIFARGDVTLNDSIVTNNRTTGFSANAGGIRSNGKLVLLRSTVSGNWTEGNDATGGGMEVVGDIIVTQSTVSGNYTLGSGASGGGMFTFHGVDLSQSTISGNRTLGTNAAGGGMRVSRQVSITQSTITANWTQQSVTTGGGLYQTNYSNNFPVAITGTIIAGNTAGGHNADLLTDPQSTKTVDYSLIGSTTGSGVTATTGIGNLLNVNPMLGPLVNNGGPTKTHALLPWSPAIDSGDPNFSAPPDFDQRGAPFTRVFDGDGAGGARIDMGAYELHPIPPAVVGDFNQDGVVGAADYTVWRDTLGASVVSFSGADGDGSGMIGMGDYDVWKLHFGESVPMMGSGSSVRGLENGTALLALSATSSVPNALAIEALLANTGGDSSANLLNGPPARTLNRANFHVANDMALLAWLASLGERMPQTTEYDVDSTLFHVDENPEPFLKASDTDFALIGRSN